LAARDYARTNFERLRQRPSVARAFAEELALYREEQARRTAA